MVNNLVGGLNHSEKYYIFNGKDDIPYIVENIHNVWNHQPEIIIGWSISSGLLKDSMIDLLRNNTIPVVDSFPQSYGLS